MTRTGHDYMGKRDFTLAFLYWSWLSQHSLQLHAQPKQYVEKEEKRRSKSNNMQYK